MSALRSASRALARFVAQCAKDHGQIGDTGSRSFAKRAASRSAGEASTGEAVAVAAKSVSKAVSNSGSSASRAKKSTSVWKDYKQLSKLRLSMLVTVRRLKHLTRDGLVMSRVVPLLLQFALVYYGIFQATATAGYVAASTDDIDWGGCGWTSLGTMLCSSAANALNQIYEVSNDAKMTRTAIRPLPAGRMSKAHALVFALVTGATGVYVLFDRVNATTAALGGANIALYAMVYTPLKQISIVNTWVGAVVGAVPPLMGWAGALGELDVGACLLAAGLYFWQLPHFMALAWMSRKDYAAGGYRMLSLVDPTGKRTAACALRNCMYLFPLGALSTWLGITSPYFAYESAFITAGMLLTAANFYAKPSTGNARILFRASLLHLPVFMGAFLLHRIPNTGIERREVLMEHARLLLGGGGLGVEGGGEDQERESVRHPSIYRLSKRETGRVDGWETPVLNPWVFPTPDGALRGAIGDFKVNKPDEQ
jgi:protoheme IX farnesyltransferase